MSEVQARAEEMIEARCRERGLRVRELPGEAFDGQTWLRVERRAYREVRR